MSSMRFDARLDTPHYGPWHPLKDAGVVADSLTGIHSAMVKCLFVVNRSCKHKGSEVSPQRIQTWRGAWRPCSGSSSACPSVTTGVTSRTARLKCAGAPSCIYHILSAIPHKLNVSGYSLLQTMLRVLVSGTRAQSLYMFASRSGHFQHLLQSTVSLCYLFTLFL
jgi:hypothetical protein